MPATTRCERCGTVGFVRREHIIEKGRGLTRFYCGHCNQTWDKVDAPDADQDSAADDRDERSKHSR